MIADNPSPTPMPDSKGNVLFLDDDKFLTNMYGMKFSAGGYTVQTSLSVAAALEVLRGGFRADVVVFDIVMPERDGFAFLQALHDEHLADDAVKIALTNQGDDAEKKKAEEFGVDRYIMKASMIPSEVVQVVADEIERKKKH